MDDADYVLVERSPDGSRGGGRRLTRQASALSWATVALSEAGPALSGSFHVARGASTELSEARERSKRYFMSMNDEFDPETDDVEQYAARHAHLALLDSYVGIQAAALDASIRVIFTSLDQIIEAFRSGAGYDKNDLIGGVDITGGVTLVECIRMVGNWYRHVYEWRDKALDDKNWNLQTSQRMGVDLLDDSLPRAIMAMLPFRTYLALEEALEAALAEIHFKLRPAEQR